jgi:hypothetical protein
LKKKYVDKHLHVSDMKENILSSFILKYNKFVNNITIKIKKTFKKSRFLIIKKLIKIFTEIYYFYE